MENDQISSTQPIVTSPNLTSSQSITPSYVPAVSKPSSLPITILSILLLISITGIAYQYTQIQSLKKQSSTPNPSTQATPTLTTTPTPTASPATDQIANWKTYTDETGQFQLKYPTTLVEGPTSGNFRNYKSTDFSLSIGKIDNRMSVTNNKQFNTLDEYIKADYDDISDKQTILLDNKQVIRFKTRNIIRVIFFSVDKKTINIIDMEQSGVALFDQILSTFKFTN